MLKFLWRYRLLAIAIIQAGLLLICYNLCFVARFDFETLGRFFRPIILQTLPVLLITKVSVFHYFRLFSDEWNSEELNDLPGVIKASIVSSTIFAGSIYFIFGFKGYPRSAFVLDFLVTILVISGARFLAGVYLQRIRTMLGRDRTLIVGNRELIRIIINSLRKDNSLPYEIVGVIDTEEIDTHGFVEGVPVLGTIRELPQLTKKYNIGRILIAEENKLQHVLDCCPNTDVEFRVFLPWSNSTSPLNDNLRQTPHSLFTRICSVLFVNRVYPPDMAATGQILAELAGQMKLLAWQITVVASQTDFSLEKRKIVEGVNVERVRGIPFSRKTYLRRALSYLSLYPAIFWRILSLSPTDVLITMTDPPLILVLGSFFKFFRRFKLVHWAQDIYPEIAESAGIIGKNTMGARLLELISTWGLRRHDRIICIGRCMYDRLIARGIPASSITVIPNWGDTANVWPIPRQQNPFREQNEFGERPVIMYSGNLGVAHPFEAILDAAKILQYQMPEALLAIVGNGPRLNAVKEQVRQEKIDNVHFFPLQPHDRLAESLSAGDLHLACMYEELSGLVVPSKVYGIMAAGRPCLFIGPKQSEAARVIQENDCGAVLPVTLNGDLLAAEIIRWLNDRNRLLTAGERARHAAQKSNLEQTANAFDRLLRRELKVEDIQIKTQEVFVNPTYNQKIRRPSPLDQEATAKGLHSAGS